MTSTTILADIVEGFVTLAGPDFTWDGVKGGDRWPSSYMGRKEFRVRVRNYLHTAQGGICPVCGDTMTYGDTADGETNHIVSQGPGRRGYFAGNVFVGHPTCNTDCERRYGAIVPVAKMARPDVIPTDLPRLSVLSEYDNTSV